MAWNSVIECLPSSKAFEGTLQLIAKPELPEFKVPEYTVDHPDEEGNYYGPTVGSQGGCFDGRYFYQSFLKYCYNQSENYAGSHCVNDAKNIVTILKYDVLEEKTIAVSDGMQCLNHSNDMTYHPKKNQLLVCNSRGNKKRISFLNADTLAYEGCKQLEVELYAISYHEKTDRFVLGISGLRQFAIANGDFSEIRMGYGDLEPPKTYAKQNICCDDAYIYCLYSGKKGYKDAVFVFDWEGHFVTFIELDFGDEEPENLSVYEGALFVGGGKKLYNISGLKEIQIK